MPKKLNKIKFKYHVYSQNFPQLPETLYIIKKKHEIVIKRYSYSLSDALTYRLQQKQVFKFSNDTWIYRKDSLPAIFYENKK